MLDILIKNAQIIDGSGKPSYKSDVGVEGCKIRQIGNLSDREASIVIDATGLILCPGFIDSHGHSDLTLFYDCSHSSKLLQGITTEVSGNCGLSLAPTSMEYFELLKKYLPLDAFGLNFPDNWQQFNSHDYYMKVLEKLLFGINMSFFVGQGTLRIATMGFENRKATSSELGNMCKMMEEAMENGALGISTGLIYAPGTFTPKEELIELCKIVQRYGGSYSTHIRNESHDVINAIKEAVDIGRQTGVQVIISHHKVAGKANWGKSKETLQLIEEANAEGLKILFDIYPYCAGASSLVVALPPQYLEGGTEKMLQRLSDLDNWSSIKNDIVSQINTWDNFVQNCGFDGIQILYSKDTPNAQGKTIKAYAQEINQDEFETLFELILRNKAMVYALYHFISEEDLRNMIMSPYAIFGTDNLPSPRSVPSHPRNIGSFPRVLKRYVKEQEILSLEEAVRKMTSIPARHYGLRSKGLIQVEYDADLVLFSVDRITDKANYLQSDLKNEGIAYVIINGEIAVKNDEITGTRAGKVIRKIPNL